MVLRTLPLLLAGACLPPEPELLEPPLTIRAAQPDGEVHLPDATVQLQRAAFSLADLVLDGPGAEPVGDWARREVVEVLGSPEPLGRARVYEGRVEGGTFSLVGDPGLDLRGGVVIGGDTVLPFDLAAEIPFPLPVEVVLDVAAERTGRLVWEVDLAALLGAIDWAAADGPVTATGEVLEQLEAGLSAPGTWSIVQEEPHEP